jgi:hypothetical protein
MTKGSYQDELDHYFMAIHQLEVAQRFVTKERCYMSLKPKFGYSLLFVSLICLVACNHTNTSEMNANNTEDNDMQNIYFVFPGRVTSYKDGILKLSLGSTDREKYIDEQGVTRKRNIANLSLWKDDNLYLLKKHFRVHEGQRITFDKYQLRAIEINWKFNFKLRNWYKFWEWTLYYMSLEIVE